MPTPNSSVVHEATEHADAAFKFVEFTQSEAHQLGMAKVGQMTVKPEFADAQAKIDPYFQTFSDQLETARARLPIPQAGEVDAILSTELVPAFEGKVGVKEALSSAAKQIDALLAENK